MHRIRLLGPWEIQGPSETVPRTVTMPQSWRTLFGELAGTARFTRWFYSPTNLDEDERVWLSLHGVEGGGQILLNGLVMKEVTSGDTAPAVDITNALQPRNRLDIELAFDPAKSAGQGGLTGEIALLIEVSAEIEPGAD